MRCVEKLNAQGEPRTRALLFTPRASLRSRPMLLCAGGTSRLATCVSQQPTSSRSGTLGSVSYGGPELCRRARSARSSEIVASVNLQDPYVAALVTAVSCQVLFNLLVFFNLDRVQPRDADAPGQAAAEEADADEAAAAAAADVEEDRPALERLFPADGTRRPWWQRPPQVWPPRLDDPLLVAGDVLTTYSVAYVSLAALTTGREAAWLGEPNE